jgi:hypothetical protein
LPFIIINDPSQVEKILKNLQVSAFNAGKTTLEKAANFAVGAGRQEVHVITGHTKRNIQQQRVSDDEIKILSKSIYSGWENKRGGDHAFFDKMYDRTKQQFPQIAMSEVTHNIRSARVT